LEYGRAGLQAELPDGRTQCLSYQTTEPLANPEAAIRQALAAPLGSPSLMELASGRKNACIAICDVTRPVPNRAILPPLLETLENAGISRRDILILIATGMHRPNEGDELREMVGPYIAENYRIENHDGHVLSQHSYLGDTASGVPIWIDSRYVGSDLKITVGLIEPHFMAGFSGGRKLICPGLAAWETISAWHSPKFLEHPNARAGCLEGNPVHEENTAIALKAGCDFIVNVVIDAKRQILGVAAGDMQKAFLEGTKLARRVVTVAVEEPFDIVVTTGAGYPLDATYYQTVKGIVAAMEIVKPGGTIIIASAMSEGIGSPQFRQLLEETPSLDAFMERILHSNRATVDQWQLEEFIKARRKAKVKVVSDGLSAEILRKLHVEPAESVETAVAESLAEYGPDAKIAVIPKGPYVMAKVIGCDS
jgi:nickel-dependent lactate racemase